MGANQIVPRNHLKTREMTTLEILEVMLPPMGAALAVWMKLSNDVTQLKSRVYGLEQDRDEMRQLLKETHQVVLEIKLLLAKKGMT